MTEPWAFLNGQFVPSSKAVVPVYDAGFVLGTTVAEQVRTFHGRIFRLDRHLQRMAHSLRIVDVDPGIELAELGDAARELAARNYALLDPDDDLGLSIFVTPGPYSTMAEVARQAGDCGPLVCMHTYPLPFHLWADKYRAGQSLVVSDIHQVPPNCWPPELKCRSRMHYYLADLHARRIQTAARALLLDQDGWVLEASTANVIVFHRREGMLLPPLAKILPGVSMSVVTELAEQLGIPCTERDLSLDEVRRADEVMLCSTSPCVWPVTELDGRPIGSGLPGEISQRLLAAWSDLVELDIVAQAERFSRRQSALLAEKRELSGFGGMPP